MFNKIITLLLQINKFYIIYSNIVNKHKKRVLISLNNFANIEITSFISAKQHYLISKGS
jgi:hypothetical protein